MVLVQHCANNSEYSTCYLHQYCVVVSQQCHRIASFLRLVLSQISGTVFHCYLGNAVLEVCPTDSRTAVSVFAIQSFYMMVYTNTSSGQKLLAGSQTMVSDASGQPWFFCVVRRICGKTDIVSKRNTKYNLENRKMLT